MQTREKESRSSGIIIILILLLGFFCIIVASGWALRFAPSWVLNTNMGSNLSPNSDFLTSRPVNLIEPLDPAILTQPAWIDVFLTPGISFPTRTPLPTSTVTSIPSITSTPIIIPTQITVPTSTLPPIIVVVPTNTKKKNPPPPPPPPPTATNTAVPPPPSADLQITKTDNATEYAAGISVQYTIVVTNAGPVNAIGASVADTIPISVTGTTINCIASGTAACGTNTSTGNSLSYVGVNIPVGAANFITITVNGTISAGTTGNLANTATVTAGAGQTDPTPGNNSATDTDLLASPFPAGSIGNIPAGSYADYKFSTDLVVSPGSGSYLIYYPQYTSPSPTLQMDVVILQIGDGQNWYTVFEWGDTLSSNNGDITSTCGGETDNCSVPLPPTNPPGVTINLNGVVPDGNYPYIRIYSPPSPPDTNGGVNVNTITKFP